MRILIATLGVILLTLIGGGVGGYIGGGFPSTGAAIGAVLGLAVGGVLAYARGSDLPDSF